MSESGEVVAKYDYTPFGKLINTFGNKQPGISNAFLFSSEYHDEETGLVYYNYRYYNPELGRWMSCDPIGERGGLNLYGMVNNDPIGKWDYLGYSYVTKKVKSYGRILNVIVDCNFKKEDRETLVKAVGKAYETLSRAKVDLRRAYNSFKGDHSFNDRIIKTYTRFCIFFNKAKVYTDFVRLRREMKTVLDIYNHLADELDDLDGTQYKYGGKSKVVGEVHSIYLSWEVTFFSEFFNLESAGKVRGVIHELSHLYSETKDGDYWGLQARYIWNGTLGANPVKQSWRPLKYCNRWGEVDEAPSNLIDHADTLAEFALGWYK